MEKITLMIKIIRKAHVEDRAKRSNLSITDFFIQTNIAIEKKIKKGNCKLLFARYPGSRVVVGDGTLTVTVNGYLFYLSGEAREVFSGKWALGIRTILDGNMIPRELSREHIEIKVDSVIFE